jgi:hypothetical protein
VIITLELFLGIFARHFRSNFTTNYSKKILGLTKKDERFVHVLAVLIYNDLIGNSTQDLGSLSSASNPLTDCHECDNYDCLPSWIRHFKHGSASEIFS